MEARAGRGEGEGGDEEMRGEAIFDRKRGDAIFIIIADGLCNAYLCILFIRS